MNKNKENQKLVCSIVGDKNFGYSIQFNYGSGLSGKILNINTGLVSPFDVAQIKYFFEKYLENVKQENKNIV